MLHRVELEGLDAPGQNSYLLANTQTFLSAMIHDIQKVSSLIITHPMQFQR